MRHSDLKRKPDDSPGQRLKYSQTYPGSGCLRDAVCVKKMWGHLTVAHSNKFRRTFCSLDLARGRTVSRKETINDDFVELLQPCDELPITKRTQESGNLKHCYSPIHWIVVHVILRVMLRRSHMSFAWLSQTSFRIYS